MEFTSSKIQIGDRARLKGIFGKIQKPGFWGNVFYKFAVYLLLFDLAFVFLFPFIYMIITSIKSPMDLADITVKWIPRSLHFRNYVRALELLKYHSALIRTAFVTILATIGHILSCSLIAYGFARYSFPFRDSLFSLVILTIIIPVPVLIISLVIVYSKMGWLNTYLPLIIPTFFGFGLRGGLFIFIFRQFFVGLPYELEEAARIDGCGSFRIYWNIVLPVASSAVLVCTILSMVWHWNDYFEPAMYILKPDIGLLPSKLPGLYALLNKAMAEEAMLEGLGAEVVGLEGVIMAATFLIILPILIIYLFLQRRFMEGIERSGLVG